MAKPIAKITVRCPHCAAEQQEPELAKSTFCRRCSQYFAITSASLASAPLPPPVVKPAVRPPSVAFSSPPPPPPAAPGPSAAGGGAAAGGFRAKFEEMLGGKPKQRTARCFECNSAHEVSGTATSSTCKACGAYIDLQDYKINGNFSRNVKTRGVLHLGPKGDLSSSKVMCDQATILGKMRGNLHCTGRVTVRTQGRLYGTLEVGELVVEKGSEIVFSRPVRCTGMAEIYGHVSGHIVCDSHITVFKTGLLDGDVEATGFVVESGGFFQGELSIKPRRPAENEAAQNSAEPAAGRREEAGAGAGAGVVNPALPGGGPEPVPG